MVQVRSHSVLSTSRVSPWAAEQHVIEEDSVSQSSFSAAYVGNGWTSDNAEAQKMTTEPLQPLTQSTEPLQSWHSFASSEK